MERAAELLEKLTGGDAGECPICMDGAQDAVLTACAHGPFCRECIISSLQHQVRQKILTVDPGEILIVCAAREPCCACILKITYFSQSRALTARGAPQIIAMAFFANICFVFEAPSTEVMWHSWKEMLCLEAELGITT